MPGLDAQISSGSGFAVVVEMDAVRAARAMVKSRAGRQGYRDHHRLRLARAEWERPPTRFEYERARAKVGS